MDIETLIILCDTIYLNDRRLERPIVVDRWVRKATKYGSVDGRTDHRTICYGFIDEDTARYGDVWGGFTLGKGRVEDMGEVERHGGSGRSKEGCKGERRQQKHR